MHRLRRNLMRVTLLWVVIALPLLGSGLMDRPPAAAGFVRLHPSDKLMHAPRGDAAGVMRFARAVNSYRMDDTRDYVYEIYRLAPLVGLDPAILIGQSALETGYWRGKFWISDLNPAGIGIYDDNQPTSFHWANGVDAARGHIYHLYTYAAGVPPRGHILYPYRHLTPGVDGAVRLGFAGTITTIRALEGSWALLYLYAWGLCNKANEILGYAEDTAPSATRTATRTRTPSPTATALPPSLPVRRVTASAGNDPRRAVDGDPGTSWAVLAGSASPSDASLQIDLGGPVRLSSVRWLFRLNGYADEMRIRASLDGRSWTTLANVGGAPANRWQRLSTTAAARWIRFEIRNPNADPALGYLAEVAAFGRPVTLATATRTATPRRTATTKATTTRTPVGAGTPSATVTRTPTRVPTKTPPATSTVTATVVPTRTSTPTPSSTATTAPTATPVATDTPLPTDTPVPTETPLPTETPTPTETPSPTPVPATATATLPPP